MAIRFDAHGHYEVCDECGSRSDVHESFISEPNEEVDLTALPVDLCVDCRQAYRADGFEVVMQED